MEVLATLKERESLYWRKLLSSNKGFLLNSCHPLKYLGVRKLLFYHSCVKELSCREHGSQATSRGTDKNWSSGETSSRAPESEDGERGCGTTEQESGTQCWSSTTHRTTTSGGKGKEQFCICIPNLSSTSNLNTSLLYAIGRKGTISTTITITTTTTNKPPARFLYSHLTTGIQFFITLLYTSIQPQSLWTQRHRQWIHCHFMRWHRPVGPSLHENGAPRS